jgi:hypothetical protein
VYNVQVVVDAVKDIAKQGGIPFGGAGWHKLLQKSALAAGGPLVIAVPST